MKCDVVIVGAGSAGIAAAISAANTGMNVVLLEQEGYTGGQATSAIVGTICGLYYRDPDQRLTKPRFAVQGFARSFAEQIALKSCSSAMKYAEGLFFLPYKLNVFHQLAFEQLLKAGVKVLLNTTLNKVWLAEGKIVELRCNTNNQSISLFPSVVIDCSGNAQVSTLASLPLIEQKHYQSGALVFQVEGLPQLEPSLLALNFIRWIKRGIDSGDLDKGCDRLFIIPGTVDNGQALLKLGLPGFIGDNAEKSAEYEIIARSRGKKIISYLKQTELLMKDLSITMMAEKVGIRSGYCPQGLQLLEQQPLLACKKPDDGVAIGAWPIEFWGRRRMPEMDYFSVNDFYLIPAGTLVSKHLKNLFFAGRSISATERAIASARVIGTCLSTGSAAGMMAAEYVMQGGWQSAINKIRRIQVFSQKD